MIETIYRASDGKEFYDYDECEIYENSIKKDNFIVTMTMTYTVHLKDKTIDEVEDYINNMKAPPFDDERWYCDCDYDYDMSDD